MNRLLDLGYRWQITIFIGVFIAFHLPYFINWNNSVVQIGDNLDGMLPTIYSLTHSTNFFSFSSKALIEGYNQQLYRNALFAPWNMTSIVFWVIPSVWVAYLINLMIINLISMLGLYMLLKKIFEDKEFWLLLLISLSFMALPKYTLFGGAVYSALPLVLYLFLELTDSWSYYKAIGFFFLPCLVGVVIGGFSIVIFLGILTVLLLIYDFNGFNKIRATIIYCLGVGFADLNLIVFKLTNPFDIHRVIRAYPTVSVKENDTISFGHVLLEYLVKDGFNEQTSAPKIIILSFIICMFLFVFFSLFDSKLGLKSPFLKGRDGVLLKLSASAIAVILLVYVILRNFNFLVPFSFLHQFDFSRVSSLLPSLFYILFAMSVIHLKRQYKFGFILTLLLIGLNLLYVLRGNDGWKENLKVLYKQNFVDYDHSSLIAFNRYYADSFFQKLKVDQREIFSEQKKVMCYGIHPAVASLAGLNAIDFYQNIYPLKYNFEFREYLEPQVNTEYFGTVKTWGNRLYFIDNYLMTNWKFKDQVLKSDSAIIEPKFNWNKLKKDDVNYMISSIEFIGCSNLSLISTYESDSHAYRTIFVYSII